MFDNQVFAFSGEPNFSIAPAVSVPPCVPVENYDDTDGLKGYDENNLRKLLSNNVEDRIKFLVSFLRNTCVEREGFGVIISTPINEEVRKFFVTLFASVGVTVSDNGAGKWFLLPSKKTVIQYGDLFKEFFFFHFNMPESWIVVEKIEPVESVPVKCIEVDHEQHMFLAGHSMIPTHNSVFAVNCATAAVENNATVMFFSLEMGKDEIHDRIFSSTSGVPLHKLKSGYLNAEDKTLLKEIFEKIQDYNLIIDVDPKITVDTIRARALKQAQSPQGLDFIIVDYLQLITPVGRFNNRQEQVADISRNMKLLAKQLNVPIMVLVQMNRQKSEDENAMPNMDQIRESGAISQDSDVVILLHREKNDGDSDSINRTYVLLEKNRNGETNRRISCLSALDRSMFLEAKSAAEVENELENSVDDSDVDEILGTIDDDDFDDIDDDFSDFDEQEGF